MKRKIGITLACLILVTALFAGCASTKLADGFDKDAVIEKAKQTVDVINTLDYAAMTALMRDDLEAQLSADKLKEAWDKKLTELGAFEKYDSVTVIGQKTQEADYAVAVVVAKYKNGNAVYTLSFDKDMELAGMYMK